MKYILLILLLSACGPMCGQNEKEVRDPDTYEPWYNPASNMVELRWVTHYHCEELL